MAAISGVAPRSTLGHWISPVVVGLLAIAVYSINLNYTPLFDELYHVLGAQGFLEYGEPRIGDGVYPRARLFTALVALWFDWFGPSVAVARSISVLAGGIMLVCLFAWTRAVAGSLAAWFSTILFLVSPFAIEMFQYSRFYALHALLFWLGAISTYALTANRPSPGRASLLALGAAACFAGAFYLQITTAIGLAGIALWLIVSVALPRARALTRERRHVFLVGIALVAPILAFLAFSTFGRELIWRYRWTPLWAASERNDFWFYHFWFNVYYPSLWPLFPLTALVALAHKPKPVLFSLCIFVPGLILTSFGGMKALNYIFYAIPFLFIIWGIAITSVITCLRNFVVDSASRGLVALGVAPKEWLMRTVIACTVGFMLLANTANIRAVAMLAGVTVPPEVVHPDWAAAAEPLQPLLEEASVVLTTSDLEMLYFLGDYDVLINKSRLSELPERVEFGRDPRTGRPIVSTPESVGLIIDCFPDGLIVTSKHRWRVPHQLDDTIADLIIKRTTPVELSRSSQMMAFHWEGPPNADARASCADLPPMQRNLGPGSAAATIDQ
jgi:hypothetical protein